MSCVLISSTPLQTNDHMSRRKLQQATQTVSPRGDQQFEDISMIRLLNKAKFPVYLVSAHAKNKHFALKVFEHDQRGPNKCYLNEARFTLLDHPNVIKYVHAEDEVQMPSKNGFRQVSCLMMEFAPYGDFFKFIKKFRESMDDKLIRTYFRQIIEGLEYLHQHGVCHFDLKFENLLIGKDYQLKIADFDMSYFHGDARVFTKGTKNYRAPELKAMRCQNGPAADIYSAGIMLFALKTGGVIPYPENRMHEDVDLVTLLNENSKEFFKKHCEIQSKKDSFFDSGFRQLFASMVCEEPERRATISQIKKSKWYKGSVYSPKDLKKYLDKL